MDHRATEPASDVIGHPAVPLLELQQFCGDDEWRPYLHKPFRYKGYVWATNGHILVRVADDERYQASDKAATDRVLVGLESVEFLKAPVVSLPASEEPKKISCPGCGGSGHEHGCPDCECECDSCEGKGWIMSGPKTSATLCGHFFNLDYLHQMYALPALEVAPLSVKISADGSATPLLFRFTGGVGALMPMRSALENHVDIEPSKDSPIT